MAKKALITGITGQDGSYLAELWLRNLNAKRDWGYAKEYVEAMSGGANQGEQLI